MRRTFVFAAILCVGFAPAAVPQGRADLSAAGLEIERSAGFGSIPLYFVANRGQEADGVLFAARTSRYTLALNARGLTFADCRSAPCSTASFKVATSAKEKGALSPSLADPCTRFPSL